MSKEPLINSGLRRAFPTEKSVLRLRFATLRTNGTIVQSFRKSKTRGTSEQRSPLSEQRFPFPEQRFPFPEQRFPFPEQRFPFPEQRFPFVLSMASPPVRPERSVAKSKDALSTCFPFTASGDRLQAPTARGPRSRAVTGPRPRRCVRRCGRRPRPPSGCPRPGSSGTTGNPVRPRRTTPGWAGPKRPAPGPGRCAGGRPGC